MQKIQQFYFNDIAEARQASSPYSVNYLTNRDAERDYFSPLSVATSFFVGDEYIFQQLYGQCLLQHPHPQHVQLLFRDHDAQTQLL